MENETAMLCFINVFLGVRSATWQREIKILPSLNINHFYCTAVVGKKYIVDLFLLISKLMNTASVSPELKIVLG